MQVYLLDSCKNIYIGFINNIRKKYTTQYVRSIIYRKKKPKQKKNLL